MKTRLAPIALALAAATTAAPTAQAESIGERKPDYFASDYGGVGLFQTPTARFNQDGMFTIHYSDTQEYRRTSVTLQVFPWLEATARYTDIRYRLYSNDPDFSGDQTLKDKGFDVKVLLLQESEWLPQVALGLRDVGGTGIFASEYVVLNKRYNDFDFSLGMGWGYLGVRDSIPNPFCEIADRMCQRDGATTGTGGQFEVDDWFRGPAAIFAGVNYQTPIEGLSLQAEYDSNDYSQDNAGRIIEVDSPINFGARYQYSDSLAFHLGYHRGNTLSFGGSLSWNLTQAYQPKLEPAKRSAQTLQSTTARFSDVDIEKLSQELLTEAGWQVRAVSTSGNSVNNEKQAPHTVTFYTSQTRFRDTEEATDYAARILADTLPEGVKRYEIAEIENGFALKQHNVDADLFKAAYRGERLSTDTDEALSLSNVRRGTTPVWQNPEQKHTGFNWGLNPNLSQSFGGPEDFYLYQLSLQAAGSYHFSENFDIDGILSVNLINNFDKFNFIDDRQDTPLPRVRTRVREYTSSQDIWIANLQATYTHQFDDDWYASLYTGYFERMFGGVGTEILYRPLDSNIAYGLDLNYVA